MVLARSSIVGRRNDPSDPMDGNISVQKKTQWATIVSERIVMLSGINQEVGRGRRGGERSITGMYAHRVRVDRVEIEN